LPSSSGEEPLSALSRHNHGHVSYYSPQPWHRRANTVIQVDPGLVVEGTFLYPRFLRDAYPTKGLPHATDESVTSDAKDASEAKGEGHRLLLSCAKRGTPRPPLPLNSVPKSKVPTSLLMN
jgi:hypothetical protein